MPIWPWYSIRELLCTTSCTLTRASTKKSLVWQSRSLVQAWLPRSSSGKPRSEEVRPSSRARDRGRPKSQHCLGPYNLPDWALAMLPHTHLNYSRRHPSRSVRRPFCSPQHTLRTSLSRPPTSSSECRCALYARTPTGLWSLTHSSWQHGSLSSTMWERFPSLLACNRHFQFQCSPRATCS